MLHDKYLSSSSFGILQVDFKKFLMVDMATKIKHGMEIIEQLLKSFMQGIFLLNMTILAH
jgi:hypothetical protein